MTATDALVKQARTGQTFATMNSKRIPHRALAASLLIVAVLLCPAFGQTAEPAASPAGTNTVCVLVAHDSLTGNTEKMAEGVAAGAKPVPGVVVVLKPVDKVAKEDLETADGIILAGC
ncbi:MAG: hypothetical protein KJ070_01225 [Verrucomicrobia bacterium]|nr:hypothetical protein [Verrucomicrobiota bacterium]